MEFHSSAFSEWFSLSLFLMDDITPNVSFNFEDIYFQVKFLINLFPHPHYLVVIGQIWKSRFWELDSWICTCETFCRFTCLCGFESWWPKSGCCFFFSNKTKNLLRTATGISKMIIWCKIWFNVLKVRNKTYQLK